MRYRPLSPLGDFTIGKTWFIDDTQAVAQAILTRLKLWLGEWFLDTADGTPYYTEVLGERATKTPDSAIKRRILGTPGVTHLTAYSSAYNGNTRTLTVSATVQTQFSATPISITSTLGIPTP